MVASIGAVAAPSQGISYYERDGYYAKDDAAHREASAWRGRGAQALGLSGAVDADAFKQVLEGKVPGGPRLGRVDRDGRIHHRPGRDVTLSAPKSVSLVGLIGGDDRVVDAHDRAVKKTLDWVERHAVETRLSDPETGRMVRAGNQNTVVATFRHERSRNLDPQLHTHAVLANMVQGADKKWRSMANESLYRRQKLIGMIFRNELARGLKGLGFEIEKSHADGRFEIAGVSRETIEAFSTRRAEIEAAMLERNLGKTAENPRMAERAALMTRAHKRDMDQAALVSNWKAQAAELGFEPDTVIEASAKRAGADLPANRDREPLSGVNGTPASVGRDIGEREPAASQTELQFDDPAADAVDWAAAHLAERHAVFSRTNLLSAALAWHPGDVTVEAAERAIRTLEARGRLHRAPALEGGDGVTTDLTLADERECIELMNGGHSRGRRIMRSWIAQARLHRGPLTAGQKEAVKLILSSKDRVIGIQGYAGTGKTFMLRRAKALAEKNGFRMAGLAPSASAVKTLGAEAGIESETLQRFLARNAGVAEGRLTRKGTRKMRAAFRKTVLVVDEGSLASTVQARDLLRIATALRIPRVVLVGDEKQLDAVDAGKAFSDLQRAGMRTATMDEILRQRDPDLKAAVEASLGGEIEKAFGKLGANVAEVKPDNIAGAVAARWLKLSPDERNRTGVMAPSHVLRRQINEHIRERLGREGRIHGPAYRGERLVSRGYTRAEKGLAANYSPGDVVAFHRPYKRLAVAKGDERRVASVDHTTRTVLLEGPDGENRRWDPTLVGGFRGGSEAYRSEEIELRAGDRIRWTRNDAGLGLVNSRTADVLSVANGRVSFRLEDGRTMELGRNDPALRHLDHAWAATVHAFQGRTVDNVIAAMEAGHAHLTTQKSFYVEISRARDRAELVTDDAARLKQHLENATGERISALEGIGQKPPVAAKGLERDAATTDRSPNRVTEIVRDGASDGNCSIEETPEPAPPVRQKRVELDLEL